MKNYIKIAVLIIVLLSFTTCNKVENETISSVRLIVSSLIGTDLSGSDSAISYSDVVTNGGIFNDILRASVYAVFINPNMTSDLATVYQYVTIDQIDITYSRTDGENVEGEDVPYSFTQMVNFEIPISDPGTSTSEIAFTVVRHNAKIEPPLIGLTTLGQDKVLKLEANITFHSIDHAGFRLQPVEASLSIYCANFADEAE